MKMCAASSAAPRLDFKSALELIAATPDPKWGVLSLDHVQLCPQHEDFISETRIDELRAQFPNTQFRPHANVKVRPQLVITDASTYHTGVHDTYFTRLIELTKYMNAPIYSIHAGYREKATMEQMRDNVFALQDRMGIPVAVEGLYQSPRTGDTQLMSTWAEYEWVRDQGLYYALDLSHLNILHRNECPNPDLTLSLMEDPLCLEIHVSENNGTGDWHSISANPEWWDDLLANAKLPADVTLFSEGNLINPRHCR